jgi:hypothetical protein
MKQIRVVALSILALLLCSLLSPAQQNAATAANATVPPLIQLSNVATDEGGNSLSGVVSITFSLYAAQQGGEPLWTETQKNVQLDLTGHYSVQLGITKPNGVPTTLFTTGEARWLGVQIAEQGEQPRVLLLSVPYALKAGDAATIGGLPPSAFVLAASANGAASTYIAASSTEPNVSPATAEDVTTTGGTADYLPIFSGAATVIDSVVFQTGTGATAKVGINTAAPVTTLDVAGAATIGGILALPATGAATATAGRTSQPLTLAASAYNSSTPAAVNQTFAWQAAPAGNDTATPSATLNLLFGEGATAPSQTGLHIASNGQITFATGQTFPGGGGSSAITGVTAGTDLTGGGTSGNVTLNLNTANVPLLAAANTFTGNQTVNGIFSASSNAFGVTGTAKATSGIGVGVGGTASSPSGYGVEGVNTATSGGAGVYGTSASSSGSGVEGVITAGSGGKGVYGIAPQFGVYGTATGSGSTVGVFGSGVDGLQGSGTLHGVYAAGTGASSTGVYGSGVQYGVQGIALGAGAAVGVYGSGAVGLQGSGGNYGVLADGTGSSATGVSSYGVYSTTSAGIAATYGVFEGPSALGASGPWGCENITYDLCFYGIYLPQAGVWADTNWNGDANEADYIPALLATADANVAGLFLNNSYYAPAVLAWNFYPDGGGGTGGDAVRAGGPAGSCTLTGSGDAACTGTLKSVVATSGKGAQRVETYAMQSPENWFEDAGTAQLVNGAGHVNLESVFGQTVNTGVEYHVFLTPDGDCKGLYVSSKSASEFEVRELGGGAASIAFEYRIMAKRVGYENVRLKNVTERFNKQEAQSKKMHHPARASSAEQSGSVAPMPPLRAAAQPRAAQPR